MTDAVPTTFLITGRALANYALKGHAVEQGFLVLRCSLCAQPLAISPSGAARLHEHAAAGDICGALCTTCAIVVTRPGVQIEMSEFGAKLVESTPGAKELLSILMERAQG